MCDLSSCVTPAGTSNELDVQNEWEENTHTHTQSSVSRANSSGHVYLTPTYDAACSFVSSGALCTMSGMYLVG